jgi:hypothetical protein
VATDYESLRAAIKAERDEPGAVTKPELDAVLAQHPPSPPEPPPLGAYDDGHYDPEHYA